MSGPAEISKEGERILAASRRPDGTLRKPVRIRAGYTPQDEISIYQSKAALFKQGMPSVPPGYDQDDASTKPRTKAAKKNEKRKEKKLQTCSFTTRPSGDSAPSTNDGNCTVASVGSKAKARGEDIGVVEQMCSLTVSQSPVEAPQEDTSDLKVDLERRIRALRKKIRLCESLQALSSNQETLTPEQVEKLSKLATWHKELQDLEANLGKAAH